MFVQPFTDVTAIIDDIEYAISPDDRDLSNSLGGYKIEQNRYISYIRIQYHETRGLEWYIYEGDGMNYNTVQNIGREIEYLNGRDQGK